MNRVDEHGGYYISGDYFNEEDIEELIRIQSSLKKHEGILATLDECVNIWFNYSSDLRASWLSVPEKDEDITSSIKSSWLFTSFEEYCCEYGVNNPRTYTINKSNDM